VRRVPEGECRVAPRPPRADRGAAGLAGRAGGGIFLIVDALDTQARGYDVTAADHR